MIDQEYNYFLFYHDTRDIWRLMFSSSISTFDYNFH